MQKRMKLKSLLALLLLMRIDDGIVDGTRKHETGKQARQKRHKNRNPPLHRLRQTTKNTCLKNRRERNDYKHYKI